MNKYLKFILLAVIIVAGFVGIKLVYDNLSKDYKPENGLVVEDTSTETTETNATTDTEAAKEEDADEVAKAIDFTVQDRDGNSVDLYSKIGKPIVINFWASWCSPCKAELPDFQLAYEEYGQEVEFMMVNLTDGRSETVEGASGFINAQGYTFPVYFDVNQEGAMAYYVASIPTTYFIDADGNIVAYAQGMLDYDTLKQGIDMITE
ncbi:MAG: TlpA family protein disulfide reductase [Lachnospiraceae bacterium]|nr:TlpA family protein disulfide reductase [Lachnospiraceae bacterium]